VEAGVSVLGEVGDSSGVGETDVLVAGGKGVAVSGIGTGVCDEQAAVMVRSSTKPLIKVGR
jgi:hypothetical protein